MIVLDTNVISEIMRPEPHPGVYAWMAGQPRDELWTTAICEAEILFGIAKLDEGRRKRSLELGAATFFRHDIAGRVLSFDRAAAAAYAEIAAGLGAAGRGYDNADVQIAAIARAHGFAVATRNIRHFAGCGIELIDPFGPQPGP